MSLQPFRKAVPEKTDEKILLAQVQGIASGIRLSNAYKLRQMELEMTLSLAEEVMEALKRTDNPLVRPLLLKLLEDWKRQSGQIVNGF